MKEWTITIRRGSHVEIECGLTFEQMNRKLKKELGCTIEYTPTKIKDRDE